MQRKHSRIEGSGPAQRRTNIALIPLTQGCVTKVDAADFPGLCKYAWYVARKKNKYRDYAYAARNDVLPSGKTVTVFMHRQILSLAPGSRTDVDHVNGDGLDNRRANLRIATRALNSGNKRRQANKQGSEFKGVYPNRGGGFRAQIRARRLGNFRYEADAAGAYNRAARLMFGEFANYNNTGDWQQAAPELPLKFESSLKRARPQRKEPTES